MYIYTLTRKVLSTEKIFIVTQDRNYYGNILKLNTVEKSLTYVSAISRKLK